MENEKNWFALVVRRYSQYGIENSYRNFFKKEFNLGNIEEFYYPFYIKDQKKKLYFPSYMFINAVWTNNFLKWELWDWRIKGFIRFGSKAIPESIPKNEMETFMANVKKYREGKFGEGGLGYEFKKGDRVLFIKGPFIGRIGTVQYTRKQGKRIQVLVKGFKDIFKFFVEPDALRLL